MFAVKWECACVCVCVCEFIINICWIFPFSSYLFKSPSLRNTYFNLTGDFWPQSTSTHLSTFNLQTGFGGPFSLILTEVSFHSCIYFLQGLAEWAFLLWTKLLFTGKSIWGGRGFLFPNGPRNLTSLQYSEKERFSRAAKSFQLFLAAQILSQLLCRYNSPLAFLISTVFDMNGRLVVSQSIFYDGVIRGGDRRRPG